MRAGADISHANVLRGVVLVVTAVFLFALADVVTKRLTMAMPVPLVMAVRYLVSFQIVVAVLAPRLGASLWHTRRTGLVVVRALCLAAASLTMGLALRTLPVGETVAIIFLSPFAVLLLSGPVLGEKVRLASWICVAISFAGVLAILRPGGGLDPTGVVFAVVNAGLATAYLLLTRILSRTETTAALMFHTMLIGFVAFLPFALGSLDQVRLGPPEFLWMAGLGLLATAGHFLFTAAYRHAPAAALAPFTYLHLVWAGLLGWVVFGHMPDGWSLLGMAAVIAAGAGVTLANRMTSGAAPEPPDDRAAAVDGGRTAP